MPDSPEGPRPPIRVVPLDEARKARGQGRYPVARSKVATSRAFGRVRADRLFGFVGVAIIIASLFLVFTWEKPVKVAPTVPVQWQDEAYGHVGRLEMPANLRVLTDEGASITWHLNISQVNVYRVNFTFQWVDDVGDEIIEYDMLSYEVMGPFQSNLTRGQTAVRQPSYNAQEIFRPVTLPNKALWEARDPDEARAAVREAQPDMRNGTGDWTVVVTLDDLADDFSDETTRERLNRQCPAADPTNVFPFRCTPDTRAEVRVYVEYRWFTACFPDEPCWVDPTQQTS